MNEDKIPTIPCRECLIKPLCKSRIDQEVFSVILLALDCCILDEWLRIVHNYSKSNLADNNDSMRSKLKIVQKELS
jgi:hypothetical protein